MGKVKPLVGIVMGSKSDLPVMREACEIFGLFEIPYEVGVYSAHRSPAGTMHYAKQALKRGLKVIIAGAGGAAHLAGAVASQTVLPVIAVPLNSPLNGVDSFYATFQMPAGVPVATMGIGKSGAKNSAFLALQILGTKSPAIQRKLIEYKRKLEKAQRHKVK